MYLSINKIIYNQPVNNIMYLYKVSKISEDFKQVHMAVSNRIDYVGRLVR